MTPQSLVNSALDLGARQRKSRETWLILLHCEKHVSSVYNKRYVILYLVHHVNFRRCRKTTARRKSPKAEALTLTLLKKNNIADAHKHPGSQQRPIRVAKTDRSPEVGAPSDLLPPPRPTTKSAPGAGEENRVRRQTRTLGLRTLRATVATAAEAAAARSHDVLGQVPGGGALGVRFWRCSFSTITEPVCSFSTRSSILSTSRTNDPMSYYSNSTFRDPKWAT